MTFLIGVPAGVFALVTGFSSDNDSCDSDDDDYKEASIWLLVQAGCMFVHFVFSLYLVKQFNYDDEEIMHREYKRQVNSGGSFQGVPNVWKRITHLFCYDFLALFYFFFMCFSIYWGARGYEMYHDLDDDCQEGRLGEGVLAAAICYTIFWVLGLALIAIVLIRIAYEEGECCGMEGCLDVFTCCIFNLRMNMAANRQARAQRLGHTENLLAGQQQGFQSYYQQGGMPDMNAQMNNTNYHQNYAGGIEPSVPRAGGDDTNQSAGGNRQVIYQSTPTDSNQVPQETLADKTKNVMKNIGGFFSKKKQ
eukprot:CAMPEP_0115010150 /NCGR_PEP_ID=MMETSP0216-20121206/23117_1 /TAXON_ID=223996 /ORGANISM="Protocruzia adherens, Strain Boccale" /LENGTH=305 /DNA_ID=CAMNT_0002378255 /DNA_START=171 /DNA_END=1088 /DNA_ORIENTATION=+